MLDAKALRVAMLMKSCTAIELSKAMGISKTALYRRLRGVVSFTVQEAEACRQRLELTSEDVVRIFFAEEVA